MGRLQASKALDMHNLKADHLSLNDFLHPAASIKTTLQQIIPSTVPNYNLLFIYMYPFLSSTEWFNLTVM